MGTRVTQIAVEVPLAYNPHAKITSLQADVAVQYNPNAHISNIVVEVVRQSAVANNQSPSDTLSFTQNVVSTTAHIRSISQTLGLTQTVSYIHTNGGSVFSQSLAQTLNFSELAIGLNKGKATSQTLTFTQTATVQKNYRRSVLQTLNYTETLTKSGGVINVDIHQFFAMADRVTRTIAKTVLQSLSYVQSLATLKGLGATQTLVFTTTVAKRGIFNRKIAQALTFTQTVKHTTPIHLRQTFVITQTANMGLTITDTCDKGTLGDTALGDYTPGTDCGPGGPNGRASDSFGFTQSLVLTKVFHRTVAQVLSFNQTIPPLSFIRYQGIVQFLEFKDKDFPRTLPLGNGSGYTFSQPVAIITHAQSVMTLASRLGVITLPAPQFGDSVKTNDKVTFAKVMSTKTYTYVKRVDRLALKYTFLLGTLKAKELKRYYIANINEYIYLTTWRGEIYIGKFGNNPIEFTTTGRFEYAHESVVADVEFQGVRIHG